MVCDPHSCKVCKPAGVRIARGYGERRGAPAIRAPCQASPPGDPGSLSGQPPGDPGQPRRSGLACQARRSGLACQARRSGLPVRPAPRRPVRPAPRRPDRQAPRRSGPAPAIRASPGDPGSLPAPAIRAPYQPRRSGLPVRPAPRRPVRPAPRRSGLPTSPPAIRGAFLCLLRVRGSP